MKFNFSDYYNFKGFIKKLGPLRLLYKEISPDVIPLQSNQVGKMKELVFVTGIHRSGTSWIGDVLSYANDVAYWREPYNPSTVKSMSQQYLYLLSNINDEFYKKFTNKMLMGKYVGSVFDYTNSLQWFQPNHHLIKDPTAAFMLDWVMNNYNSKVVVVSRHPAGFISSIIKLDWDFDFNNFLRQEQLMDDYLNPFKDIMLKHNYRGIDVAKGAVLWGVVYYVLEKMAGKHNVVWVNYEDVCENPMQEFKKIVESVSLKWNQKIEQKILKSTSSDVTFSDNITKKLTRDTSKMSTIWKDRLPQSDIELIQKIISVFGITRYTK